MGAGAGHVREPRDAESHPAWVPEQSRLQAHFIVLPKERGPKGEKGALKKYAGGKSQNVHAPGCEG
jgi:hypothetical protein